METKQFSIHNGGFDHHTLMTPLAQDSPLPRLPILRYARTHGRCLVSYLEVKLLEGGKTHTGDDRDQGDVHQGGEDLPKEDGAGKCREGGMSRGSRMGRGGGSDKEQS